MSYSASCRLGRLGSSSLGAVVAAAAAAVAAASDSFDASHWALQRNAVSSLAPARPRIHFDCSILSAFDWFRRPNWPYSAWRGECVVAVVVVRRERKCVHEGRMKDNGGWNKVTHARKMCHCFTSLSLFVCCGTGAASFLSNSMYGCCDCVDVASNDELRESALCTLCLLLGCDCCKFTFGLDDLLSIGDEGWLGDSECYKTWPKFKF